MPSVWDETAASHPRGRVVAYSEHQAATRHLVEDVQLPLYFHSRGLQSIDDTAG
jgi:hypothetical protein